MPGPVYVVLSHVVYLAILCAIVWLVLDWLDEHDRL